MAWIYLAESAESLKPWLPGCEQSPIVKESYQLSASFFPGCIEEKLSELQSGMTLELFEDHSCRRLMSSPEAFRVRISALRGFKKAWAASGRDYFTKLSGLPKKQKPQFFSSRMSKVLDDSFQLSEMKLKALGMNAGMVLSKLPKWAQDTKERDGFLLPTPVVSQKGYDKQKNGQKTLSLASLWRMGRIPTPLSSEAKGPSGENRNSPRVSNYWAWTTGTRLSASFVEILMGYPIDSTVSELWATEWFRCKSKKRSKSSQASRSKVA